MENQNSEGRLLGSDSVKQKKVLFIDRDGTLILEPPVTFQVDKLEQLEFLPGVFANLAKIAKFLDFELVMVSNQDGLGTPAYPREAFDLVQSKVLGFLEKEGVRFSEILIDESFEYQNLPTRKPGKGLLGKYLSGDYNLAASYVIGDRLTDVELAANIGSGAILLGEPARLDSITDERVRIACAKTCESWEQVAAFLFAGERTSEVRRITGETDVFIGLHLDGAGKASISTGLGFFDHMLDQIARHSGCDLEIKVKGDLHVDEHHTVEDTAIALGEAFYKALISKRGLERYGFSLPMDDSSAHVLLDFGGRPWLVWNAEFKRERVGDMPTELFSHFFKSFSDSARCNLNIRAEGINEHHKIESIFKAFARAIKMAVRRDILSNNLPSTKGII